MDSYETDDQQQQQTATQKLLKSLYARRQTMARESVTTQASEDEITPFSEQLDNSPVEQEDEEVQPNDVQEEEEQVRAPDQQVFQSLLGPEDAGEDPESLQFHKFTYDGVNGTMTGTVTQRSCHPKTQVPKTPPVNYRNIQWMPRIKVSEWLDHSGKMILFEWCPLSYFVLASLILPKDEHGCSAYASQSIHNIIVWVFGPILVFRFIGTIFFNTQRMIIYQIMVIYGWLIVSLCIWDIKTFEGMLHLDRACYRPLSVSILNLVTMLLFYCLILSPYLTIVCLIPFYVYEVYKAHDYHRKNQLTKHYLIKSMPSIAFSKKLFADSMLLDECLICMEEFKEGEDFVTPLACDARHMFHSDCIEQWLKNENSCPFCKKVQTPTMMRSFSEHFYEQHHIEKEAAAS